MKPLKDLLKKILFLTACLIFFVLTGNSQNRAAWMPAAKWGVMNHYLADWIAGAENIRMSEEQWNELFNNLMWRVWRINWKP